MNKLHPADMQRLNEETYSRKHVDKKVKQFIQNEYSNKISEGVTLLEDWLNGSYYESKQDRLNQLKSMDLELLVTEIFVGIAYCQAPVLFTTISAQLASRLGFSDKKDSILTIAEILAILCETDTYDIVKEHKQAPMEIVSRMDLGTELWNAIDNSAYLPPMVCEPLDLENNYSSGYLTHNESLILGKGNHHDGNICLDVLDSKNKVPLKLDTEFLCQIEESPTKTLKTSKQLEQWNAFKKKSYRFYTLLVSQGNRFYLTHKVDKRGRIYAQGYHINTQGTPFKKAMVELADEEYIEVPQEYRK